MSRDARQKRPGATRTTVGLVTPDESLLEAAAEPLRAAGFGVTALHPEELAAGASPPATVLLDARHTGDWEKLLRRLRPLAAGRGPERAVLILLGEGADSPGTVPHPAITGFERAPADWHWLAQRLRQLTSALRHHTAVSRLLRDLMKKKREVRSLQRLAHYDELTGLVTRRHFLTQLRGVLDGSLGTATLLYMDLDGFKRVNDTLGHWTGDLTLQHAADRLRSTLRSSDVVGAVLTDAERPILGRIGGDEFAIVLPAVDRAGAARLADELVRAFARPFHLPDHTLNLGLSVGVSTAPADAQDAGDLLRYADVAMYHAKRGGGGHAVYSESLGAAARRNSRIDYDVREALRRGEFHVAYQPRLRVRGRELVGAEALVRWRSPVLSDVSPMEFIPIAERTGAIVDIGNWVFEQVVQTLDRMRHVIPSLRISVNVSAQQFDQPGLAEYVLWLLQSSNIPASRLEIEITESQTLGELSNVLRELEALHRAGTHVSLDDFGTGFSSLGVLLDLPMDCIKLDRTLMKDIHTSSDAANVARAMIVMGHSLGLTVVAEGVEEEAQMRVLEQLGCDEVQGFLFSRPVAGEQLLEISSRREGS